MFQMMLEKSTHVVVLPYEKRVFVGKKVNDYIVDDVRKRYTADGEPYYVKVGEINTQEFISSFADGCSLQSLLTRCGLLPVNEKINYLQQVESVDGDFSNLPLDFTDAFLRAKDIDKKYPGVMQRCLNGEKVEDVFKSIFNKKDKNINNSNKENIENGEKQSSND